MQQHVQDVKRLVLTDKKSDSFAAHFASLVPTGTVRKEINNFIKVKCEIVWQGNPLNCVKTFGTNGCKLCAKERLEILKLTRFTPDLAINSCNEVYGACRHKPRFHRFDSQLTPASSTDESVKDERVRPDSTKSQNSQATTDSAFSEDSDKSFFSDSREPELLPYPTDLYNIPIPMSYEERKGEGLLARYRKSFEGSSTTSVVDEYESLAFEVGDGSTMVLDLELARELEE
jgi:hypothetical protein